MFKTILLLALASSASLVLLVQAGSSASLTEMTRQHYDLIDSSQYKVVSDEDQKLVETVKHHITTNFVDLKTFPEVFGFLEKVKLLVQKHPKNIAFAQGDLKELMKFLTQDMVTKLIRVDTEPFTLPLTDDKIPLAWHAMEEDDLVKNLFGVPLRLVVEQRKLELTKSEPTNHKDNNNFFANFWCKISGGCSQHQ